jgi:hypothetical protein
MIKGSLYVVSCALSAAGVVGVAIRFPQSATGRRVLGLGDWQWKHMLEKNNLAAISVLPCQKHLEGLNRKAQGSKAFLNVLRTAIV